MKIKKKLFPSIFLFFVLLIPECLSDQIYYTQDGCFTVFSKIAKYQCQINYSICKTSSGQQGKIQKCLKQNKQILQQVKCLQQCCNFDDKTTLTSENMKQCRKAYLVNSSNLQTENPSIIMPIIYIVVAFLLVSTLIFGSYYYFKIYLPIQKRRKRQIQLSSNPCSSRNDIKSKRGIKKVQSGEILQEAKDDFLFAQNNQLQVCSICAQNNSNCYTSCYHKFHYDCIKQEMAKNLTCPQCANKEVDSLTIVCQLCSKKLMIQRILSVHGQTFYTKIIKQEYKDKEERIICNNCLESKQK